MRHGSTTFLGETQIQNLPSQSVSQGNIRVCKWNERYDSVITALLKNVLNFIVEQWFLVQGQSGAGLIR